MFITETFTLNYFINNFQNAIDAKPYAHDFRIFENHRKKNAQKQDL